MHHKKRGWSECREQDLICLHYKKVTVIFWSIKVLHSNWLLFCTTRRYSIVCETAKSPWYWFNLDKRGFKVYPSGRVLETAFHLLHVVEASTYAGPEHVYTQHHSNRTPSLPKVWNAKCLMKICKMTYHHIVLPSVHIHFLALTCGTIGNQNNLILSSLSLFSTAYFEIHRVFVSHCFNLLFDMF